MAEIIKETFLVALLITIACLVITLWHRLVLCLAIFVCSSLLQHSIDDYNASLAKANIAIKVFNHYTIELKACPTDRGEKEMDCLPVTVKKVSQ